MFANFQANDILFFVCIGIVTGWIVGELRQGQGYGLFGNAFIGVIGSIVGGFLFEYFNMTTMVSLGFPVFIQTAISAVVGAGLLLFVLDRLGMRT